MTPTIPPALLPLPAPEGYLDGFRDLPAFTADQMHAYALAHIAAERERCAKLVESVQGWTGVREVAAAIREV